MSDMELDTQSPIAHGQQLQGQSAGTVAVACAFCSGTGRDPFGLLSPLSTCQVCGGQGQLVLRLPIAPCVFCRGTGVHPGLRMTCTTCDGVGMVEIPEGAVTCPCCAGTGRAADYLWPGSALSCTCCGGKGVVSARRFQRQLSRQM